MKKQTALEWLEERLNLVKPTDFCSIEKIKDWLNEAKGMEREQIQDAFYCGIEVDESKVHSPYRAAEDYFKQNY